MNEQKKGKKDKKERKIKKKEKPWSLLHEFCLWKCFILNKYTVYMAIFS